MYVVSSKELYHQFYMYVCSVMIGLREIFPGVGDLIYKNQEVLVCVYAYIPSCVRFFVHVCTTVSMLVLCVYQCVCLFFCACIRKCVCVCISACVFMMA